MLPKWIPFHQLANLSRPNRFLSTQLQINGKWLIVTPRRTAADAAIELALSE
jgi:hypothetical protein